MMGIRDKFVAVFGEDEALCMEASAEEHANGINDANRGTDPFKWAILICIGYECFTKDRYRQHHGFHYQPDVLKAWICAHADLGTHDGDSDYLALFGGAYTPYITANTTEPA